MAKRLRRGHHERRARPELGRRDLRSGHVTPATRFEPRLRGARGGSLAAFGPYGMQRDAADRVGRGRNPGVIGARRQHERSRTAAGLPGASGIARRIERAPGGLACCIGDGRRVVDAPRLRGRQKDGPSRRRRWSCVPRRGGADGDAIHATAQGRGPCAVSRCSGARRRARRGSARGARGSSSLLTAGAGPSFPEWPPPLGGRALAGGSGLSRAPRRWPVSSARRRGRDLWSAELACGRASPTRRGRLARLRTRNGARARRAPFAGRRSGYRRWSAWLCAVR
jgi:hypothetical protein